MVVNCINCEGRVVKVNPLMPGVCSSDQNCPTCLLFQEFIWRRDVHHIYACNSPSDSSWINAQFQRYFQTYHRSRRYSSWRPSGVKGLSGTEMTGMLQYDIWKEAIIRSCCYLWQNFSHQDITHWFMPVAPKLPDYFGDIFLSKAIGWKILEGELFIKSLSTTVLQIVCKFLLYYEVIFQYMSGPDVSCQIDLQAQIG